MLKLDTGARGFTGRAQRGLSLIEILVAMAVGIIVTAAMVALMANTLNTGTRTIEMTRLQQEMRAAMHLLTRDLRRSNYTAESILCFGNMECETDYPDMHPGDITVNDANDCVVFQYDRWHGGTDYLADPTSAEYTPPAGFRRITAGGIGVVQMLINGGTTNACGSGNWVDVTDRGIVDVSEFRVCMWIDPDDAQCSGLLPDGSDDPNMPDVLSYDDLIDDDGAGTLTFQRVRKLQMTMTAQLIDSPAVQKTLIDRIRVRNDVLTEVVIP